METIYSGTFKDIIEWVKSAPGDVMFRYSYTLAGRTSIKVVPKEEFFDVAIKKQGKFSASVRGGNNDYATIHFDEVFNKATMIFSSDTDINKSRFNGVDFRTAIFDDVEANEAWFRKCQFGEVKGGFFRQTRFLECEFTKNISGSFPFASFDRSSWVGCEIKNTSFEEAILNKCKFECVIFDNVDLIGTEPDDTIFENCTFKRVVLPYHHGFPHTFVDNTYYIDGVQVNGEDDVDDEALEAYNNNIDFLAMNDIKY